MTLTVTPGVSFLAVAIPKFIGPPILVHGSLRYLVSYFPSFTVSDRVIVCVWIFSFLVWWYMHAQYLHFARVREARRLGAILPPQVPGRLPGNIDLIWTNFFARDLYLGDGFARAIDGFGTTFSNNILGEFQVFTANPQNIKLALATDFGSYEKGPKFNEIANSVLGEGVFNSDGDMWQFHRKLTRPFFGKERVTDFGIFDAKTNIAIQKMQERFDSGQAIDFQDICSRFTLDSACEFLLGVPIQVLEDPLPLPNQDTLAGGVVTPANHFARAFADAQISVSRRARLGVLWPLFEIFGDRTAGDMRVVRGFIEPIVQDAMRKRKEGGVAVEKLEEESLLQHLLNMKLIVDETINILLAGRDTTAGLLTFMVYCLAMHPDVLARLREEIVRTIGPKRVPTFDDVRGMKYLRAVLNETLRLFPSVPFNGRNTRAPALMEGDDGQKLYIPANTRVTLLYMHTQRHKPFWGEDAHLFDPDRFLDERAKTFVTSNPFVFVPFNAGPRICLGQQFAYNEASFFMIRLLQKFDRIELAPACQPAATLPPDSWKTSSDGTPRKPLERCVINSHLTLYVEGGLWLRMSDSKATDAHV
ncbi:cytochrome P450 monooxygenase pc-1 [Hysterangium stoloniferum]|nr:cytochrome P450 monooxygenase pc-1 [Hysterangium stoloniferum]